MNQKHIVLLTSIGAGLEYYDFVIYAFLATFISKNFFPNISHYSSIMATFAVFGVGYIVRPLGGMVFGIIGDRFGRKKVFTATLFLMAISTFLMSIIPAYAQCGLIAPFVFMVLRIFQGLSYGAELPGSLTFLSEHVSAESRGKKCGFMIASMGMGVAMASFVSFLSTHFLTAAQMFTWGWRLPFMLGAVLAVVGYFLRKNTTETPLFAKVEKTNFGLLINIVKGNYKNVLRGFGYTLFPACFVVFGLFMPSYLHDYFKYDLTTVYFVNTIGNILVVLLLPFLGWGSDYIGRKRLLIIISSIAMVLIIPLFRSLTYSNVFALCSFIFCYYVIIAALASCYFTMLAENFPTSIRYTGIAFCYNTAYVFAALVPVVLSYFCKLLVNPANIGIIFVVLAVLTIFSAITVDDQTRKELA